MKQYVIGFIVGMLLITALYLWKVPQCQEDAVLIGAGHFEQGRWTVYQCGPAVDDYLE